jgi:CheY-like chemotaxis protein/anti-sigma regulatory factor (Ser/Thr protein kinase)
VDVHALLADVAEGSAEEARGAGLELVLALRARRHLVSADPLRLRQIVWNLVRNAVRFTPAGGTITVGTHDHDERALSITVADTGLGFDRAAAERMFEPFHQGPRSAAQGGLGLGLAIAKGLVAAHGGRITATSAGTNRGACFTVVLPTTTAVVAPAPAPSTAAPPDGRAPISILLVEDHEDTARALAMILEHEGYRVELAHSVRGALAASERRDVDIVVSDLGLPDGSGLDLMRELKSRKPMRGIALTGYGRREDLDETTRAGFERHLTKPVDVSTLIATIESLRNEAA